MGFPGKPQDLPETKPWTKLSEHGHLFWRANFLLDTAEACFPTNKVNALENTKNKLLSVKSYHPK